MPLSFKFIGFFTNIGQFLFQNFQPFFSGGDVMKHSSGRAGHTKKGMGLGLAFVKTIIERHKGSINIESQPGKGSKIYISLPVDRTGLTAAAANR